MPTGGLNNFSVLEQLSSTACRALLASHSFGRVCFSSQDRVVVVMTTYAMRGVLLHFRAAAFGPVVRRTRDPAHPVTVQVDGGREDGQPVWTVSVLGTPTRVTDTVTLASLWPAPRPHMWETGLEAQWLTLDTEAIEGQRVRG